MKAYLIGFILGGTLAVSSLTPPAQAIFQCIGPNCPPPPPCLSNPANPCR